MKKLIAISVVFALIAGTAFAADVGVDVFGKVNLIQGDTHKDAAGESPDPTATGGPQRIRAQASGENDDGTFGGWIRLQASGGEGSGVNGWGYGWWKPVEQVRLLIGSNGGDGFFGADGVTRWGFYQGAGDVGIVNEYWKFSSAFFGGWDNGLLLTITPMDPLEINIAIPYFDGKVEEDGAANVYKKTNAQVAYNIDGIGKFALTYTGGLGILKPKDPKDAYKATFDKWIGGGWDDFKKALGIDNNFDWDKESSWTAAQASALHMLGMLMGPEALDAAGSKAYVYFGLSAIENIGIDIGFGYALPVKGAAKYGTEGLTYNEPIAAGVGVNFTSGDFGIKARVQGQFGGKLSGTGYTYKIPLNVVFDVLPSYAVNENLTALLSAGVDYTAKNSDFDGDYAKLGFHVEPYLNLSASAANFFAGIRIETDGQKWKDGLLNKEGSSAMTWSVPIGIAVSF